MGNNKIKKEEGDSHNQSILKKLLVLLWIVSLCCVFIGGIMNNFLIDRLFERGPIFKVTACIQDKSSRRPPRHIDYRIHCEFYLNGERYRRSFHVQKLFYQQVNIGDCIELLYVKKKNIYYRINLEKGTFKCHPMPYSHEYVEGE